MGMIQSTNRLRGAGSRRWKARLYPETIGERASELRLRSGGDGASHRAGREDERKPRPVPPLRREIVAIRKGRRRRRVAPEGFVSDHEKSVGFVSKPAHIFCRATPVTKLEQDTEQSDGGGGLFGNPDARAVELGHGPAAQEQDAADFFPVGHAQARDGLVAVLVDEVIRSGKDAGIDLAVFGHPAQLSRWCRDESMLSEQRIERLTVQV